MIFRDIKYCGRPCECNAKRKIRCGKFDLKTAGPPFVHFVFKYNTPSMHCYTMKCRRCLALTHLGLDRTEEADSTSPAAPTQNFAPPTVAGTDPALSVAIPPGRVSPTVQSETLQSGSEPLPDQVEPVGQLHPWNIASHLTGCQQRHLKGWIRKLLHLRHIVKHPAHQTRSLCQAKGRKQ
jgi:hypothetical protein